MPDSPAQDRPLRAVFVDLSLIYSSGVTQVTYKLARHRQPGLLDMLVVSLNKPDSTMVKLLGASGVRVDRIENSNILRSAIHLRHLLKEYATDIVVANSFRCYLIAKMATAGSGTPIVYWIHTINQIYTSRVRKFLFPLLSKRDALIYVSKAVRENNRPRGHQGQDAVIYNSVEGPEMMQEWQPYGPEKRIELGIPDDAIVLGYTAHFVYYKDHHTLLNAFDTLSQRFPKLYLVLVGEGADREVEVARAEQFAARNRILFLGRRRDARALLGLIDLYVHVASEEAFGLSVVEAMLARRPVIAARAFALTELIRDGKTGLLFETGNVQELERQITRLIEDRAYAAQLAAAGEQDCRRRFPPEPFAQQVTAFLRSVGSTRSSRAKNS